MAISKWGIDPGYSYLNHSQSLDAQREFQLAYEKAALGQAQAQMNAARMYGYACLGQPIKGDGGGRIMEKAPLKKKPASYREELQEEINAWLR